MDYLHWLAPPLRLKRANTSQRLWARICLGLTKRWNEDDPARWPQFLVTRERTVPRVHFLCVRHTATIRPNRHGTASENGSSTLCTSSTEKNVVGRLFLSARWRAVERYCCGPTIRGLRLRRALCGRIRSGRLPETALSLTSFRRIRGYLPKRRTRFWASPDPARAIFVGRDVGEGVSRETRTPYCSWQLF